MHWKQLAAKLFPPIIADAYRRARASRAYRGRFASWREALAASSGYASPAILEKTAAAQRAVRDGRAKFARDGVAFAERSDPLYLLAILFRQAALDGGRLAVLDFGGSLGATYFQCLPWLKDLKELRWSVVEQKMHAELGRAEFGDTRLFFFESIADCSVSAFNVLLLSSVLQYLEEPYRILALLLELRPATILIDRTPVSVSGEEFLTVQEVPKEIYEASYPSWVFSREKILAALSPNYNLSAEFPSLDHLDPSAEHRGFFFTRKP